MSDYRSIFLERDWVHNTYYGWQDDWPDPQLRVLKRRSGPVERRLILSELKDQARAAAIAGEVRKAAGPVAETVVHDLANSPGWDRFGYAPVGREGRMLNVDTLVIDLSRTEDELLARMSPDTRRRVRKAQRDGIVVEAVSEPNREEIDKFIRSHSRLAASRGMHRLDPAIVARMIADGRSHLLAVKSNGDSGPFLLTYRAGDKAIWLQGAGRGGSTDAGQLIQWRAMQMLRDQGVRWYDLGGLPSLDDSDGIYRFKKGFGGELVDLGSEHRFQTPIARLIRMGADGARRLNLVGGR